MPGTVRQPLVTTRRRLPADLRTPIRTVELDKRDLNAYRGLVGGSLEIITFEQPKATLYLNDEGKLEGLPPRSASHPDGVCAQQRLSGPDVVVGDAFLVCPSSASTRRCWLKAAGR